MGVGHGWRPLSKPMLVTRSEGAAIHELDGLPAIDAYLAERGAPLLEGDTFGERAMSRPIGVPNAHGRYDLRQIHQTTPEGALVLTTGVSEQSVLQVMCSDDESLLAGAREAAESAMAGLDGPPELAIAFSCCTRVPLLGERVGEEVEQISAALGGAPVGRLLHVRRVRPRQRLERHPQLVRGDHRVVVAASTSTRDPGGARRHRHHRLSHVLA